MKFLTDEDVTKEDLKKILEDYHKKPVEVLNIDLGESWESFNSNIWNIGVDFVRPNIDVEVQHEHIVLKEYKGDVSENKVDTECAVLKSLNEFTSKKVPKFYALIKRKDTFRLFTKRIGIRSLKQEYDPLNFDDTLERFLVDALKFKKNGKDNISSYGEDVSEEKLFPMLNYLDNRNLINLSLGVPPSFGLSDFFLNSYYAKRNLLYQKRDFRHSKEEICLNGLDTILEIQDLINNKCISLKNSLEKLNYEDHVKTDLDYLKWVVIYKSNVRSLNDSEIENLWGGPIHELNEDIVEKEQSFIHGDAYPGNMVVMHHNVGLVDFYHSRIGHPFSDLADAINYYVLFFGMNRKKLYDYVFDKLKIKDKEEKILMDKYAKKRALRSAGALSQILVEHSDKYSEGNFTLKVYEKQIDAYLSCISDIFSNYGALDVVFDRLLRFKSNPICSLFPEIRAACEER